MSSKHPLSDEDKAAFRDAINGTSSWEDDKEEPPSQGKTSDEIKGPWVSLDYLADSEWVNGEAIIQFSRSGVSAKQRKQLADGVVQIEQKLDFHGYNSDELYNELGNAIHQACLTGIRVLLLMHGKGHPDRRRPAILKNYINQSLRQNADVLAFHSAKPAHGGAGAIYVLLRGIMSEVIIIGISGPSASGKSLLANTILNELGSDQVTVIPEDSYYNDQGDMPLTERCKTNYDHPDAFEHSLLAYHLQELMDGKTVDIPTYDFTNHNRSATTRQVEAPRIIVLEGILLFTDEKLRELMSIRIFMDTPLDICLIRRMTRDIVDRGRSLHSVINQYQQTVRPMYYQFIEPCKRYADVIVPRGGENRIAIDMIKAKMRELLT